MFKRNENKDFNLLIWSASKVWVADPDPAFKIWGSDLDTVFKISSDPDPVRTSRFSIHLKSSLIDQSNNKVPKCRKKKKVNSIRNRIRIQVFSRKYNSYNYFSTLDRVADPDGFCMDPDSTFEKKNESGSHLFRDRIRIRFSWRSIRVNPPGSAPCLSSLSALK